MRKGKALNEESLPFSYEEHRPSRTQDGGTP